MENITVNRLGQLYRLLCEALGEGEDRPFNQADLDNASRFPVRQVSMKIAMVHQHKKMTSTLDEACGFVLKGVTQEDMDASFALKTISMQQQGFFTIGFQTANIDKLLNPRTRIKRARKKAGFTIRSLAEKIEISPTTIQNIENGKVDPKMSTLQKIADACGVSMNDLWPSDIC